MSTTSITRGDSRTLARTTLFASVDPDEIKALDARCLWRKVGAGEWVIDYQAEGADVFFVFSGHARVVIITAGREMILRDIREGESFGQYSAIDGKPRSAAIVAVTDTVVAKMSSALFWEAIHRYPTVRERVLKGLVADARALNQRANEQANFDVRHRLCAELLRLSRTVAEGRVVVSPPGCAGSIVADVLMSGSLIFPSSSAVARPPLLVLIAVLVTVRRKISAQRVAFPALGHHDALQIGVSFKPDAEQIERLALVPVCPRPDGSHALHRRIRSRQRHFQLQPQIAGNRVQEVDNLKPRLQRVAVNRSNPANPLKFQVVPQLPAKRHDLLRGYPEQRFTKFQTPVHNSLRVPGLQRSRDGERLKQFWQHVFLPLLDLFVRRFVDGPVQHSLFPNVEEARQDQCDEEQHFKKRKELQLAVNHRPRIQENRLYIE